jgi:hypothetical protein
VKLVTKLTGAGLRVAKVYVDSLIPTKWPVTSSISFFRSPYI